VEAVVAAAVEVRSDDCDDNQLLIKFADLYSFSSFFSSCLGFSALLCPPVTTTSCFGSFRDSGSSFWVLMQLQR